MARSRAARWLDHQPDPVGIQSAMLLASRLSPPGQRRRSKADIALEVPADRD
ncbi:MAG: hypothetical protein AB7R00_27350 [Kofleriaceae bacterium]